MTTPLRYLGRRRTNDDYSYRPCAQLCNVPALIAAQRCPWCALFDGGREAHGYQDCQEKNRCGYQSLLFAWLQNDRRSDPYPDDHFTPTPLLKSVKIDLQTRFLQYVSSDLSGFQCSSLCHFYPQRIANKQTITACSNQNGCNRNGSFWDLLTLFDPSLLTLPDFQNLTILSSQLLLFSGEIVTRTLAPTIAIDANGMIQVYDTDDVPYFIVNLNPTADAVGGVLMAHYNSTALASWGNAFEYAQLYPSRTIVYRKRTDQVAVALYNAGINDTLFTSNFWGITRLTLNSGAFVYLYRSASWFLLQYDGDVYYYRFRLLNESRCLVIQLGSSSGKYLGGRRGQTDISKARKVKVTPSVDGDIIWTLTNPTGSLAQFLQEAGFSQTLFY